MPRRAFVNSCKIFRYDDIVEGKRSVDGRIFISIRFLRLDRIDKVEEEWKNVVKVK